MAQLAPVFRQSPDALIARYESNKRWMLAGAAVSLAVAGVGGWYGRKSWVSEADLLTIGGVAGLIASGLAWRRYDRIVHEQQEVIRWWKKRDETSDAIVLDENLPRRLGNLQISVDGVDVPVLQMFKVRLHNLDAGDVAAQAKAGFYRFLAAHPNLQVSWRRAESRLRKQVGSDWQASGIDVLQFFNNGGERAFFNPELKTPFQDHLAREKRNFRLSLGAMAVGGICFWVGLRDDSVSIACAGFLTAAISVVGAIGSYQQHSNAQHIVQLIATANGQVPPFQWTSNEMFQQWPALTEDERVQFAVRWNEAYANAAPGKITLKTDRGEYKHALARMRLSHFVHLMRVPTCGATFSQFNRPFQHPSRSQNSRTEIQYEGSVQDFIRFGEEKHNCPGL